MLIFVPYLVESERVDMNPFLMRSTDGRKSFLIIRDYEYPESAKYCLLDMTDSKCDYVGSLFAEADGMQELRCQKGGPKSEIIFSDYINWSWAVDLLSLWLDREEDKRHFLPA